MKALRSARAALAAAVVAAAAASVPAGAASATGAAPNPSANIPPGALPAACASAGRGALCERASIRALDRARVRLGLRPYRLPARFVRLSIAHQWLILANLDRIAYSLPAIAGTSAVLDRIAAQAAAAHRDPDPWPLLQTLHGQSEIGFGSNWAFGQPNGLLAYYFWMYDDGYRSGNLDCRTPSAPGCWGHRQNVLGLAHAPVLTMGAAALASQASYALTIVETSTPVWHYVYRWPK